MIFLETLLDYIFPSMRSKHFFKKERTAPVMWEGCILLQNHVLLRFLNFWSDISVWNFSTVYSFDCSNNKVTWPYHTVGVSFSPGRYFFALQFPVLNIFWVFCAQNRGAMIVCKSWDEKDSFFRWIDLT